MHTYIGTDAHSLFTINFKHLQTKTIEYFITFDVRVQFIIRKSNKYS